jgi:hypothetical protein
MFLFVFFEGFAKLVAQLVAQRAWVAVLSVGYDLGQHGCASFGIRNHRMLSKVIPINRPNTIVVRCDVSENQGNESNP